MYKNGDICPVCASGHLHRSVKDKIVKYKEESITIKNFVTYSCDECDESLMPKATIRSSEKVVRDLHRKVDGLLTSNEIKKIREALGFTQEAFAEVLGVGSKNFARYENGTVTQNRATDHLLRILFEIPEALKIISKEAAIGVPLKDVVDAGGSARYSVTYGIDRTIKYNINM